MPAWFAGGREVGFVSDRQASPGVWAVDTANGREHLLQQVAGTVNAPSWSPDSSKVLFSVVANNESRLMLGAEVISSSEDVFPFRGQWISATEFLYTADGKIKRRALGAQAPRTIEFSARVQFDRPTYTQNRRDFDGMAARPVQGILKPAISPDAKHVVFPALGDLWLMPIGGKPQRLKMNDAFIDTDPAWSRDGKNLVFSSDRSGVMDLWIRDMQTGQDRRLTHLPCASSAPPCHRMEPELLSERKR